MSLTTRLVATASVSALSLAVPAGALAAHASPAPKHTVKHSTTLTIKAKKSTITKKQHDKATIIGTLRSHKTPLADEPVSLVERTKGKTRYVATGLTETTDASGKVTFTLTQTAKKEQYRLVFAGDTSYKASKSGTITVTRAKTAPSS